jgi:hypothetical protein
MSRWTLKGRTSGPPGSLEHLVVAVADGPVLPDRCTVEVIPADSPNVLSVEEARAIGELTAGTPTPQQEQVALAALARLSKFAGDEGEEGWQ